jgi:predicted AAA+ superfamily ATPase
MYITRALEGPLKEALSQFPVVVLTGARQVGKSTLLTKVLQSHMYVTLDDPLLRRLAQEDPSLFLRRHPAPCIVDEIQYAPELLPYIKMLVDTERRKTGQYVLTGSQIFPLMQGVSETLAGRVAIFHLYPLSWNEITALAKHKSDPLDPNTMASALIRGFYPEFWVNPNLNPNTWYGSYLSTYVERDVRSIITITDLGRFQTFISLLAVRAGQLLNLSEVAKECGVSQPTAKSWLSVLEATYIVHLLKPYSKNITKRLIKSPKLFFVDTGLLCYLLGVDSAERFFKASERGHIFENMIVIDAIKRLSQQNSRASCYFYRTANGVEVDLLVESRQSLKAFEIKLSQTPTPSMANHLSQLKTEIHLQETTLLSLREKTIPLLDGVDSIHWSDGLKTLF